MRTRLSASVLFFAVLVIGACREQSISEETARRIAESRFESFCKEARIDSRLLSGPKRIRETDPGFVFEWTYFEGDTAMESLEIWVSDSGTPEVGGDSRLDKLFGTLESGSNNDRFRQHSPPRP